MTRDFFYRMPQCHTQTQPKYRFTCFLLSLEASCCIGTESTDCFYWDFFWSWWYSSTCWNETVALDIGTIMILKLEALLIDNTALPPNCYLTNLQLLMFCLDIFFSLSLLMMKRYLGNHWTKKIWSAKSVVRMFTIFMQQRSSFSLSYKPSFWLQNRAIFSDKKQQQTIV